MIFGKAAVKLSRQEDRAGSVFGTLPTGAGVYERHEESIWCLKKMIVNSTVCREPSPRVDRLFVEKPPRWICHQLRRPSCRWT